jgi:hypothetical protein
MIMRGIQVLMVSALLLGCSIKDRTGPFDAHEDSSDPSTDGRLALDSRVTMPRIDAPDTVTLSQTVSGTLTQYGDSCNPSGIAGDDQWVRYFDLTSPQFNLPTEDFHITAVKFGIWASSVSGQMGVQLLVNNTSIGQTSFQLGTAADTTASVPISGDVPAGDTVEVSLTLPEMAGSFSIGAAGSGSGSAYEWTPAYYVTVRCSDPGSNPTLQPSPLPIVIDLVGYSS